MKKNILIFFAILTSFSLIALSYLNGNKTETVKVVDKTCKPLYYLWSYDFTNGLLKPDTELFYDLDSRFIMTIRKEDLNKAKSFLDIIPANPNKLIVYYYSMSLNILDENYRIVKTETGNGPEFTAAQIKLLQSIDYSSDILIRAEYKEKNRETGQFTDRYSTPHITVVPEKQAVNSVGKEKLIAYVKENTQEFAATIIENKLKSGKVTFTITKEGKIANVSITETSAYPAFDKKMAELISTLPGTWEPATNLQGEKIDQKFVFSFGKIGC